MTIFTGKVYMFVIIMFRTEHGSYKIEALSCDTNSAQISDSIEWNNELSWWSALKLFYRQYNEYD